MPFALVLVVRLADWMNDTVPVVRPVKELLPVTAGVAPKPAARNPEPSAPKASRLSPTRAPARPALPVE